MKWSVSKQPLSLNSVWGSAIILFILAVLRSWPFSLSLANDPTIHWTDMFVLFPIAQVALIVILAIDIQNSSGFFLF